MDRDRLVTIRMAAALMFASVARLDAYTDPGSGALFLQMVAAAAVGALFYWRKLTGWVRRLIITDKDDVAR